MFPNHTWVLHCECIHYKRKSVSTFCLHESRHTYSSCIDTPLLVAKLSKDLVYSWQLISFSSIFPVIIVVILACLTFSDVPSLLLSLCYDGLKKLRGMKAHHKTEVQMIQLWRYELCMSIIKKDWRILWICYSQHNYKCSISIVYTNENNTIINTQFMLLENKRTKI